MKIKIFIFNIDLPDQTINIMHPSPVCVHIIFCQERFGKTSPVTSTIIPAGFVSLMPCKIIALIYCLFARPETIS